MTHAGSVHALTCQHGCQYEINRQPPYTRNTVWPLLYVWQYWRTCLSIVTVYTACNVCGILVYHRLRFLTTGQSSGEQRQTEDQQPGPGGFWDVSVCGGEQAWHHLFQRRAQGSRWEVIVHHDRPSFTPWVFPYRASLVCFFFITMSILFSVSWFRMCLNIISFWHFN